ncbi:upstream stimulatory factor 2-like, partial [Syngnathus typhle]
TLFGYSLDKITSSLFCSHDKQEPDDIEQLQEEGEVEDQSAGTISAVQQAAFSDHNVQYQFCTDNNGGQVTDDNIDPSSDATAAVSVVSAAAFAGAPQAVIQNPFSNVGSPVGETVAGETRFAYFPAAAVTDGRATAVSVQTTSEPTITQGAGQFYVMMTPLDVLRSATQRSIAPRTHTYPGDVGGSEMLQHGSTNWRGELSHSNQCCCDSLPSVSAPLFTKQHNTVIVLRCDVFVPEVYTVVLLHGI